MTRDDLLDHDERSQRYPTSRRREKRSRRRNRYAFVALVTICVIVLMGPSLLSHTSIGRSMVERVIGKYGFDSEVSKVRIGWATPASISGIRLRGQVRGSEISIAKLDVDMTLLDMIRGSNSFGTIALRDVDVTCTVADGNSSLEEDLQTALAKTEPEEPTQASRNRSDSAPTQGTIELTGVRVHVVDEITQQAWELSQASSKIALSGSRTQASFAGVLTESNGRAGSIQGVVELAPLNSHRNNSQLSESYADQEGTVNPKTDRHPLSSQTRQTSWRIDLTSESLPLSLVSLVRRRMGEAMDFVPAIFEGDASGTVVLTSGEDGSLEVSLNQFRIRNLSASQPDSVSQSASQSQTNGDQGESIEQWRNELASVDGELSILPHHIVGRHLVARTDFATASLDGAFSRDLSWSGASDNPLRWLEGIHGEARIEVDLAKLQTALPGVLPIRRDARLKSGQAVAWVASKAVSDPTQPRVSKLSIKSGRLRATSMGRNVVIDPVELTATVISDRDKVRAEEFRWNSEFGTAVGQGDLQSGDAELDVDFWMLAQMLRPLFHFDETRFAGKASGEIRWDANARNQWHLKGNGIARDLVITLPSGDRIRQPTMQAEVEAVGEWSNQSLNELSSAQLNLLSDHIRMEVKLKKPVESPSFDRPIPLQIEADGDAEVLFAWLRPWLPAELEGVKGRWTLATKLDASTESFVLRNSSLFLVQPRIDYGGTTYSQPQMKLDLDGAVRWPENTITAQRMVVAADAFSAVLKGEASIDDIDCDVRWRAKPERLLDSIRTRSPHQDPQASPHAQTIAFQSRDPKEPASETPYMILGDFEGSCSVKSEGNRLVVTHQTSVHDLEIVQRKHESGRKSSVWFEPNVEASGTVMIDAVTGTVTGQPTDFATDWFSTTIDFQFDWNQQHSRFHGSGPAKIEMEQFAKRTAGLAGVEFNATGIHETELQIDWMQRTDQGMIYTIDGTLGWDECQIAGMNIDRSRIPFVATEKEVSIDQAIAAIGSGRLQGSGIVRFEDETTWVRIDPGTVADQVELTPEMTDQWLKYLAPMAANSARVRGKLSVQLDEALVDLGDPAKTRVSGRLNISSAEMSAGPLANQMFGGLNQLIALTGGRSISQDATLITMPPQTVDFSVSDGDVSHQRMYFQVDRARVVTSGRVRMRDSSMEMIAQIPIDERWLGRNLQGLAGQTITLPIDGTISRPSLDSRIITKMAGELGAKAIQSSAETYLQRQFEKGLGSLFGK